MLGCIFAKPLQADILENGKDNPAPNTYKKYTAAADWCVKNDAVMLECTPSAEHPTGCYKVVTSQEFWADYFSKMPEAERAALQLSFAKAERAALVEKATVEIDGMVFDADETSQNRLSRGIIAALALGLSPDEKTEWTLADNSSAMVTMRQMARALLAAGQYQTSVWRMPYQN